MAEIKYPVRAVDDFPVLLWTGERHILDADNRMVAMVREPADAVEIVRILNAAHNPWGPIPEIQRRMGLNVVYGERTDRKGDKTW